MALAATIALGLGEAIVRGMGLRPLTLDAPAFESYFLVSDQDLGYCYRPIRSAVHEKFRGQPTVTTDRYGYRAGPAWNPDGDGPIVLLVGDSTTFCAEVPDDATGAVRLWELLDLEGGVRVLNAGVRGYSTLQSTLRLEQTLAAHESVAVAVYLFTPNDLFDNLQPAHKLPRCVPTAWWSESQGVLHVLPPRLPIVPWGETFESRRGDLRYSDAYKVDFYGSIDRYVQAALNGPSGPALQETTFAAGMAELSDLCMPIAAERLARQEAADRPVRQQLLETVRQRSALVHYLGAIRHGSTDVGAVPGARETDYAKSFGTASSLDAVFSWAIKHRGEEVVIALLERMKAACVQNGTVFVASAYTLERDDPAARRFGELCKLAGVTYAPLGPEFDGPPVSFAARTTSGAINSHWNRKGTRAFARGIAPTVRASLAGATGGDPGDR